MKKIFIVLISCGVMAGCLCKNKKTAEESETATTAIAVPDAHNSRNSLDYTGTYSGVLPCADCPGIRTEIALNADGTYEKTTEYLERNDGKEFVENGTYTWDESGSKITLNSGQEADPGFKYQVQENRLVQLDLEGNKIESELAEHYILKKK